MNLSYGSQGDEVKRLQTALNQNGYSLSVDGIYGSKTQAAVRDYQSKQSLSVDGIAGPLTQGKLYGSGSSSGSSGSGGLNLSGVSESVKDALKTPYSPPKATETETPEAPDLSYLDAAWEALQNQGPFSYDLESDPLYQQYAAMYQRWGKSAMEDATGQAAALTGGYGNSYAQQVGAQAYQNQMQDLAALAPEFYDRALDAYTAEGNALGEQFSAALQRAEGEYQSYRDRLEDQRAQQQREEELSYQEYRDMLDYYLQLAKLENADYQWRQEYALRALA